VNDLTTSFFVPVYTHQVNGVMQPVNPVQQTYAPVSLAGTLIIASALSIGSNMVDVQNGAMTFPGAVANGFAKGMAATLILNATPRETAVDTVITVGILATAGYMIDQVMNTDRGTSCRLPKGIAA
jgi:hypothetical protein